MARFVVTGMQRVLQEMERREELTGKVAEVMLMSAAADVRVAWQMAAEKHGHRDTGRLIASIGYPRKPKDAGGVLSIDIYPQGTDSGGKHKKPVRNAEKAFVLHYGTSKKPGSHWVDTADRLAEPMVDRTMATIWDQYIETGKVPAVAVPNWHAK